MAVMLLILFPFLLMFNTPLAGVAMVSAIVLLYRGKTTSIANRRRRSADADNDPFI